jgi:hypothetical protein
MQRKEFTWLPCHPNLFGVFGDVHDVDVSLIGLVGEILQEVKFSGVDLKWWVIFFELIALTGFL